MRLLAAIESDEAIRAILGSLGSLGLPARAPPVAPARSEPTTGDLDFGDLPAIQR